MQVDKAGYCSVFIYGKRYLVHRMIYMAFVGEIKDNWQIHHINGNKNDNRIENLSALTAKEHQHLHKQIYPITKFVKFVEKNLFHIKQKEAEQRLVRMIVG